MPAAKLGSLYLRLGGGGRSGLLVDALWPDLSIEGLLPGGGRNFAPASGDVCSCAPKGSGSGPVDCADVMDPEELDKLDDDELEDILDMCDLIDVALAVGTGGGLRVRLLLLSPVASFPLFSP